MSQDRVDRHDFNAYRAALIDYNHEDVYIARSIHVEATPLLLLRDVSSVILQRSEQLLDAYWEWIDDGILGRLLTPILSRRWSPKVAARKVKVFSRTSSAAPFSTYALPCPQISAA